MLAGSALGLLGSGLALWSLRAVPPPADLGPFELVGAVDAPDVPSPPGAHDVVLIILCTTRKDQTSAYDPTLKTTPFLAELAARGALFDDLVNAAPWTKAASTAILTGRHALSLNMVEPKRGRNERVLPDEALTLGEAFHEAGYRTVGLTANPNLQSDFGFHVGFERYLQPTRAWGTGDRPAKIKGRSAVDALIPQVRAVSGDRPTYVQVLLVDAHAPHSDGADFAEPGLPSAVADYRATLRKTDDAVRDLVGALEQAGLGDDTVWMVVNDHGEGLSYPEHHGHGHGRFLAPSAVGGVGIVVAPGVAAGSRLRGLSSQLDLAPTLWSLAGLSHGRWEGLDLSNVLLGRATMSSRTVAYTDTWFRSSNRAAMVTRDRVCQIDWNPDDPTDASAAFFKTGCFDRALDPLQERPFSDPAMEGDLRAWRAGEMARGAAIAATDAQPEGDVGEQLEALGYIEE